LSISHIDGGFDACSSPPCALPDTYFFTRSAGTFTISGLTPGASFTLFLYGYSAANDSREEVFTVGTSSFDTASGHPSSEDATNVTTGTITGTTDLTGSITGTWAFGLANTAGDIDWSGFQLDVGSAPTLTGVPEPATAVPALGALGLLVVLKARAQRNKRAER
jgi:hypothetical protein